jgi:hypothetical protein
MGAPLPWIKAFPCHSLGLPQLPRKSRRRSFRAPWGKVHAASTLDWIDQSTCGGSCVYPSTPRCNHVDHVSVEEYVNTGTITND